MHAAMLIVLTVVLIGFAAITWPSETDFADRFRKGMLRVALPIIMIAVLTLLVVLAQRYLGG